MKKLFYIQLLASLCILIPFSGNSQINNDKIQQIVLSKRLIGKKIIFGKWTETRGTETHLTYLGRVKTNEGKTYKIMNSTWIWGLSRRSTNRILIFNGENQYLGNYTVGVDTDLPTKLINKILIFKIQICIVIKILYQKSVLKTVYLKNFSGNAPMDMETFINLTELII